MANPPVYPGTPRWVKASGIVVGMLALLLAVVIVAGMGGPHGPGRHMRSGEAVGDTLSSGVTKEPAPSGAGIGGN